MIGFLLLLRIALRGVGSFFADGRSRALLLVTLAIIGTGALFYNRVEELSWLDSFYFTIVTLTSVGYGDIAPETAAGKIFTMFYLLIGIGILVALITEVARHIVGADVEPSQNEASGEGHRDGTAP